MAKPSTIQDIARHVGVGNTTVSAVLSRRPSRHVRVSEETRARILEAAQQMQYRPNGVARSLRYQKTDVIGVYSPPGYLNPDVVFSSQILGGLHRGCYAQDKDLLLHGIHRNRPAQEIYAELADGRIDGLVLYTAPDDPVVERLAVSPLPVVGLVNALDGLPSVVVDDAGGSKLLAAHLARQGHQHILYITGNPNVASIARRRHGFQDAAAGYGMEVTEHRPAVHHERLDDADLERLCRAGRNRPTAVVCWNDQTAYYLLEQCRRQGLRVPDDLAVAGFDHWLLQYPGAVDRRVPDDLAVAGFDGLPLAHAPHSQLTTIRAPWMDVASAAIALLTRRINGEDIPQETVLPVEFILGDTA